MKLSFAFPRAFCFKADSWEGLERRKDIVEWIVAVSIASESGVTVAVAVLRKLVRN